jgi:hypothetical protein
MKSIKCIHRFTVKILVLLLFLFPYIGTGNVIIANNPTGALFLPDSVYAKLPRPDWNALKMRANVSAIASQNLSVNNSVTMLITPPIGDQGQEGSCVG